MPERITVTAIVFILTGLPATTMAGPDIDSELYRQLKEEGLPRWEALKKSRGAALSVTVDEQSSVFVLGEQEDLKEIKQQRLRNVTWDSERSLVLIQSQVPGGRGHGRDVYNPSYQFRATRSESNVPYVLVDASAYGSKQRRGGHYSEMRLVLGATHIVCYTELSELVTSEAFRLEQIAWTAGADGGRRVFVSWKYVGEPDGGLRRPGRSYWAKLDPAGEWTITECGVTMPDKNHENRYVVECRRLRDGHPFPARVVETRMSTVTPEHDVIVYKLSEPTTPQIDLREFYLPHYGIPETVLKSPRPDRRVRNYLIASGIAGIVLAGVLVMIARRRSASKRAPVA